MVRVPRFMIYQAQWSLYQNGDPDPLKLDVINFYAGVLWEGNPTSFVDDIGFRQIIAEALAPENLETSVDGNNILLSWDAPMDGLITYMIYESGILLTSTEGVSSCINPLVPDIETIFLPMLDELIILQSETGMYWPGENVNSLINWDSYSAYKIKMEEDVSLTFLRMAIQYFSKS